MKPNEAKIIRIIVIFSLSCTLVLSQIRAMVDTPWAVASVCLALFMATIWMIVSSPKLKNKSSPWLLVVAAINLFVIVPELSLRLFDFRFESGITNFDNYAAKNFVGFEPDEKLFWKLKSADNFVNSFGFPGEEIILPKPKNIYRMVFLGDSITQQSYHYEYGQGYPDIVSSNLNILHSRYPKRFESVKLAVSGYSSYQGRILADYYAPLVEPDLVVVFFGWNDHWKAYGTADKDKKIGVMKTWWEKKALFLYHNIRLVQLANWLRTEILPVRITSSRLNTFRVPLPDYEQNLEHIRERFQEYGIPVIFITAPTSLYSLGVPNFLVQLQHFKGKTVLKKTHKKYNQVVRKIAHGKGVYLLDLEAVFADSRIPEKDFRRLFFFDGIHFNPSGLSFIANQLTALIEKEIIEVGE